MDTPDGQHGCEYQETALSRCGVSLPDSPDCAINYHFGMLLGVDDFRTEQGFHVGRLRRHQRALHGFGVVYGYGVSFDAGHAEIRVAPGYAVDAHGRDLEMLAAQCVGLPAWWLKHRDDDEFAGIPNKDDVSFNADVLLCYSNCLSRPVPAIADACAGGASDIAYSRICESPQLKLVPRREDEEEPAQIRVASYHLLRLLLGLDGPESGEDGNILPDDQWLLDQQTALAAMPDSERSAAMAALWVAVLARAAAASTRPLESESDLDDAITHDCVTIARLTGIHIFLDRSDPLKEVWKATVDAIDIDQRPTLLPAHVLQSALQPIPTSDTFAGPIVLSATRIASTLTLLFNKALAPASVKEAAFAVTQFDAITGWAPIMFAAPVYDNATLSVTLPLKTSPTSNHIRITVHGTGPTPLLGANLIPAGARRSDSDGSDLSITISEE
jgi:hypothetical protein